jgi:hypothetical protein
LLRLDVRWTFKGLLLLPRFSIKEKTVIENTLAVVPGKLVEAVILLVEVAVTAGLLAMPRMIRDNSLNRDKIGNLTIKDVGPILFFILQEQYYVLRNIKKFDSD